MALNNLGLGFVFTARDLASGTITRLGGAFGAMDANALRAQASYQRNFAVMGAGLAIMGAGAATLAGAFSMAAQSAEFSQELARVGGIAQANATDLERMHDAAIQAGLNSSFDPRAATQGLGALASAGLNAQQSVEALVPALDLAMGGSISVEQSARSLTAALNVFGLASDQSGLVADQMLRISNATNLEAGDMELAIGTVARGARLTRQTIQEMLPSVGLLRNTGVDVSVAAQSVSSALGEMAKNSAEIHQELGVNVVETLADGTQRFRGFMDISREAGIALEERFANPAERTAMALQLFGRFGVGAVTGVSDAISNGVRDSEGNLYQGAAAIEFLRNEMLNAGGAAEEFKDRMLDTFAGQQQLLSASSRTVGVLIGEGFERGLRPFVSGTLEFMRAIGNLLADIPLEVRGVISSFIIAGGAMTFVFGTIVAIGAAFAIMSPFLSAIAAAVGNILLAMAPFALVAVSIMALGYAFSRLVAVNDELGAAVSRNVNMVRLGLQGLVQLFTTGELSGAIAEELSRAENGGLLAFLIDIYAIGFRFQQFFRGIGIGFNSALATLGPSVERLMSAFNHLGQALGLVSEEGREAIAGMPSEDFANRGARAGAFLAGVLELVVGVLTEAVAFSADFADGWHDAMQGILPGLDHLIPMLDFLGEHFTGLLVDLGVLSAGSTEGGSSMMGFGRILGHVAGVLFDFFIFALDGAIGMVAAVVIAVRGMVQLFEALPRIMSFIAQGISTVFLDLADGFLYYIDQIMVGYGQLIGAAPWLLGPLGDNPEAVGAIVSDGEAAGRRAEQRLADIETRRQAANTSRAGLFPAGIDAEQRAASGERNNAALAGVASMLREQQAVRDEKPWNVTIAIDGEAAARATGRGQRRDDAASFGFTPAEE